MSTVTKIGALGKMNGYSPEKKALMGKCAGTIQKIGPRILKKGRDPEKCTGTVTKRGATMENVPVQFFIKYKNIGYHNCLPEYEKKPQPSAAVFFFFTFFFFFFLLSLFAPLNGIQHKKTLLTHIVSFFYLPFVPYRHNFCVTQPCQHGVFV